MSTYLQPKMSLINKMIESYGNFDKQSINRFLNIISAICSDCLQNGRCEITNSKGEKCTISQDEFEAYDVTAYTISGYKFEVRAIRRENDCTVYCEDHDLHKATAFGVYSYADDESGKHIADYASIETAALALNAYAILHELKQHEIII